jgi:hypothetical protein
MKMQHFAAAAVLLAACHGELPTEPSKATIEGAAAVPARRHSTVTYPAVFPPPCANPAPLYFVKHPAGNRFTVHLRTGSDAAAVAADLQSRYTFTVIAVLHEPPPMFFADLPATTIAGLRCEPAVLAIEQDSFIGIAAERAN